MNQAYRIKNFDDALRLILEIKSNSQEALDDQLRNKVYSQLASSKESLFPSSFFETPDHFRILILRYLLTATEEKLSYQANEYEMSTEDFYLYLLSQVDVDYMRQMPLMESLNKEQKRLVTKSLRLVEKIKQHLNKDPYDNEMDAFVEQEYLGHMLAASSYFHSSTNIPVRGVDGEVDLYQLMPVHQSGGLIIHALVPITYHQQPPEIKIVIKGTHDFKSAVLDMEHNPGEEFFEKRELYIMNNIKNIINHVKKTKGIEEFNLHVSGFSLGGAIAQQIGASVLKGVTSYHQKGQADLSSELDLSDYTGSDREKRKVQRSYVENRQEHRLQALGEVCSGMQQLTISALDSPGVSKKVARRAMADVAYLHQQQSALKVAVDYTKRAGDPVQQTGNRMLLSDAPKAYASIRCVFFKTGLQGVWNKIKFLLRKKKNPFVEAHKGLNFYSGKKVKPLKFYSNASGSNKKLVKVLQNKSTAIKALVLLTWPMRKLLIFFQRVEQNYVSPEQQVVKMVSKPNIFSDLTPRQLNSLHGEGAKQSVVRTSSLDRAEVTYEQDKSQQWTPLVDQLSQRFSKSSDPCVPKIVSKSKLGL